uniref:Uncharacterized protein n=1 Tax=Vitis vinifera TaxID=29760 RepID=F6I5B9_VITVI
MPRLLHSKFKLNPLTIPSGVAILWTPHFDSCVSHSMRGEAERKVWCETVRERQKERSDPR